MSAPKNYYQILGISSDVGPAEIKRAYRHLVKSRHPDAQGHDGDSPEGIAATTDMMRINEAYSTLIDAISRAEYDLKAGLRKKTISVKKRTFTSLDEEQERERFLRNVFFPVRTDIANLLGAYKRQINDLSADPYDDVLLEAFQSYVDKLEDALRKGSDALMTSRTPRTLEAAVVVMRQSISQAADGLEELRYFLQNYNHQHLTMAESLFRISKELSQESATLTKIG